MAALERESSQVQRHPLAAQAESGTIPTMLDLELVPLSKALNWPDQIHVSWADGELHMDYPPALQRVRMAAEICAQQGFMTVAGCSIQCPREPLQSIASVAALLAMYFRATPEIEALLPGEFFPGDDVFP